MLPSAGDELVVKPEGFLVAGLSFVVTRGLLIDVVGQSGQSPLATLSRLVPLALGLGVVAYGVSLAVSTRSRAYIRTVAAWYLLGSAWMLLLVGVAVVGTTAPMARLTGGGVVATAVVGGGVGGLAMGVRSANNRQQRRSLDRQAEQSLLLNRLLRHEVLNALTAIRGHAGLLADGGTGGAGAGGTERSFAAVADNVERIESAVEDVGFIVRTADATERELGPVALADALDPWRDRFPGVDWPTVASLDVSPTRAAGDEPVRVRADGHLDTVVSHLVTTAVDRTAERDVGVAVDVAATTVDLVVSAPAGWLGEREREVLLDGPPEFDSPEVTFGVPVTRLLVNQYEGSVAVTDGDGRTRVTVTLPRVGTDGRVSDSPGVDARGLQVAAVVGLLAGVVMGGVLQAFSGQVAVIGGLYGVQSVGIGWVTHLFHSVVFATLFVAVFTHYRPSGASTGLARTAVLGVGYGLLLWLVAAGFVMGAWLNLAGMPSPVPNLGVVSLAGHLVWGLALGGGYGLRSTDWSPLAGP